MSSELHKRSAPESAIDQKAAPRKKAQPFDGVVAGCARRDDLIDNRPQVGCKPPRIRFYGRRAALGGPRRFPRRLAAARATLVRSEIISLSC
jgi:hypothetical protein